MVPIISFYPLHPSILHPGQNPPPKKQSQIFLKPPSSPSLALLFLSLNSLPFSKKIKNKNIIKTSRGVRSNDKIMERREKGMNSFFCFFEKGGGIVRCGAVRWNGKS